MTGFKPSLWTSSFLVLVTPFIVVAAAMSLRTIVKTMKRFYLQSVRLPLSLREAEGKTGRSLPPIQTVHIIEDTRECEDHMSKLMETRIKAVGLDCEWVSYGKGDTRPVALLQLATPQRVCYLIRLNKMAAVPNALRDFLDNKSILKFGVAIVNEDRRRLYVRNGIRLSGCVDLNHIARQCGVSTIVGLKSLAKSLLDVVMEKSFKVKTSNWEGETLSTDQITYAAWDALIALDILAELVSKKMKSSDLNRDDTCFDWEDPSSLLLLQEMCNGFVDVKIGSIHTKEKSLKPVPSRSSSVSPGSQQVLNSVQSQPRRAKSYSLRQTPLYHNYMLLAPDGQQLSTVDKKKADWYIARGLADMVVQDPPTVKLRFEPSGRPTKDREYYLTEKENKCVVCGREDGYIRKNVVPHEYRRHFPSGTKEHLSHDVLLLCVDCHQLSSQHDSRMRMSLAKRYNAPLSSSMPAYHNDPQLIKVKSHAKALARGKNIPEQRKRQLLQTLLDHYEVEEVTPGIIAQATQIDTRLSVENGNVSHSKKVVESVLEEDKLHHFQQEWRQHFLDSMQPKHLPKLWSVTHNPFSL